MAADVFGRRIDHDRRAVVEGPDGQRRGGVVDDQRDAERPADRGDFGDGEDRELRVWQRLAEIEAGAVVGGAAEILRIGGIDKARLDAELLQALAEEMDGAAVKIRRGDDVVARFHQGQNGERRRGLAGGDAERRCAAFERGQPLFERVDGRVADTRIGEGDLLEVDDLHRRGGVGKVERGRLIDGDRRGGGRRVMPEPAAVQNERVDSHCAGFCCAGFCGH